MENVILYLVYLLFFISGSAFAIDIANYFEPTNVVKTFQYSSETESGLNNMDTDEWRFQGKLIQSHGSSTLLNERLTLTVTTHTQDLPNFPTGYTTQYFEQADGYYSQSADSDGNQLLSKIFPTDVKVGQSWNSNEFWDEDSLDDVMAYSGPSGSFQDCLHINRYNGDRTELSKKVGERQHELAIICPEIGLVKSTITNIINAISFKTVTTIELIATE